MGVYVASREDQLLEGCLLVNNYPDVLLPVVRKVDDPLGPSPLLGVGVLAQDVVVLESLVLLIGSE